MEEIIHKLTSSPKITISGYLGQPMSPEELAVKMGTTRQAVDKHIKEMYFYGVLEKIWVTSGNRPRVEFKLSALGTHFYSSVSSFIGAYRERGLTEMEERVKSLDMMLISGDITQKRYHEMRDEFERSMQWFVQADE